MLVDDLDFMFKSRKVLFYLKNFLSEHAVLIESLFDVFFAHVAIEERKRFIDSVVRLNKGKNSDLRDLKKNPYKDASGWYKFLTETKKRETWCINEIIKICKKFFEFRKEGVSSLERKFNEIQEMFGLSDIEKEFLIFLYLKIENHRFDLWVNNICDIDSQYPFLAMRKTFALLAGLPLDAVKTLGKEDSPLMKYEIIMKDWCDDGYIADELSNFLNGLSSVPIQSKYYSEFEGKTIPLSWHNISKDDLDMVQNLLSQPSERGIKILFYGVPGVGKTELARGLGKALGYNVYEIKNYSEKVDSPNQQSAGMFRYRAIKACENKVDIKQSLLIIDEADELVNQGGERSFLSFSGNYTGKSKCLLNSVLDSSNSNQIWITNHYEGMDDSSRRRFDYSIGFKRLNFEQRKNIWLNRIQEKKSMILFNETDVEYFSEKYEVNAGVVTNALNNAERLCGNSSIKEEWVKVVEKSMKAYLKLDSRDTKFMEEKKGADCFGLEGLNIKGDIEQVFRRFDHFNENWKQENNSLKSINMLLWGPSGTGKTEFCKYIARRLRRRLLVRRASDLLSKYVGENEENIRNAFEEAEQEKSILFIDEIDSFLQERSEAGRNWEVSMVNEMLQGMEKFKGIFLAATNFNLHLDTAAFRRFNLKLQFDYLSEEGKPLFFKRYFEKNLNGMFAENLQHRVEKIPYLTPGDFKIVKDSLFYNPEEKAEAETIIAELENTALMKKGIKRPLGFVA